MEDFSKSARQDKLECSSLSDQEEKVARMLSLASFTDVCAFLKASPATSSCAWIDVITSCTRRTWSFIRPVRPARFSSSFVWYCSSSERNLARPCVVFLTNTSNSAENLCVSEVSAFPRLRTASTFALSTADFRAVQSYEAHCK